MTPGRDRKLKFADESREGVVTGAPWKVLIADDDRSVHDVIKLALAGAKVDGRALEFRDAYDAREACRIVRDEGDIAVLLLDLTMERERSGLEAAHLIRDIIGDRRVRIVLCTGDLRPMRAGTMEQFDLSACWQKSDLTARRLVDAVSAAIGHYEARDASQAGVPGVALTLGCVPIAGPG